LLGFTFVFLLLYFFSDRIEIVVSGLAFSWTAVFIFYDMRNIRRLHKLTKKPFYTFYVESAKQIGSLFLLLLPLGALALITSLTLNIPRYFLEELSGTKELGYFAAIVQLASIGAIIVNSIGQTIVPRLASYYLAQRRAYFQLLTKALLLAVGIGLVGILLSISFGETLLSLLYSNEFTRYNDTLLTAMLWSTFLYVSVTLGCGMTAIRSFRSQFFIGGGSLAATLIASWPMIGYFGITGAVMALILGTIIKIISQLVTIYFIFFRNMKIT
jgi:O-antigen/teichoic acid export membrane protein